MESRFYNNYTIIYLILITIGLFYFISLPNHCERIWKAKVRFGADISLVALNINEARLEAGNYPIYQTNKCYK